MTARDSYRKPVSSVEAIAGAAPRHRHPARRRFVEVFIKVLAGKDVALPPRRGRRLRRRARSSSAGRSPTLRVSGGPLQLAAQRLLHAVGHGELEDRQQRPRRPAAAGARAPRAPPASAPPAGPPPRTASRPRSRNSSTKRRADALGVAAQPRRPRRAPARARRRARPARGRRAPAAGCAPRSARRRAGAAARAAARARGARVGAASPHRSASSSRSTISRLLVARTARGRPA